jgi:putative LysE/RhtB family amino acid efflux pump
VAALGVGLGLGLFVALQPGPMSLFLVRSTLRRGLHVGLAIAAGIALVDAAYATLGAAGAAPFVAIEPVRTALGLVGAAVLGALGARTLWSAFRVRSGGEADSEVASPRRAFATAVAGTASNPVTIASWAAIFAAAAAAGPASSASGAVLVVAGVGLGSAAWVVALAAATAAAQRAAGERALRVADAVAGLGLVAFGGILAYGALRDA